MTEPLAVVEQVLCQSFHEQMEIYALALELAGQITPIVNEARDPEPILGEVLALLDRAAGVDGRIAPHKARWQQSKREPGPELRRATNGLAEVIQRLSAVIAEAERQAISQRNCLAPELDTLLRSHKMRQAYATTNSPTYY